MEVTTNTLNIRNNAGGQQLGAQLAGSQGIVIGGPVTLSFDGVTYIWWKVDYGSGVDGWGVERYLNRIKSGGGAPIPAPGTGAGGMDLGTDAP